MKDSIKKLYFILLAFTITVSVQAQPVLEWKTYPAYNGIIECMLDIDTAILAGAHGGLSCINKSTLQPTYYNSSNSGLLSGYIRALEKDTLGSIWIGTDCGLTQWQGNTWTQYTPQNSILTTGVSAIRYVKSSNSILLGLKNGNVIRIDTSGWNFIVGITGTYVQGEILDIEEDSSGNIWVASTYNGVYRFDGTEWQAFNPSSNVIWNKVLSLAIDDNGVVWALSKFSRLASYNGTSWTIHGYIPGTPWSNYLSAEENNTLWISTTQGIYTYNGINYTYHPINPLLTHSSLNCHLKEKEQKLWTGTFYYGVEYGINLNVTSIPLTPELEVPCIQSIAYDNLQGKVWFATNDGQTKPSYAGSFNDTTWENINSFNSPIITAQTSSIAIDNNSTLYLGTYNEGLWVRQNNNWSHYTLSNSNISSDSVTTLAVDFNNQLLLGFYNGSVQKLNTNNFVTLIQSSDVKCRINHIEPENAVAFWVATDSIGLLRCDYNTYMTFDTTNSGIPSNHVEKIKIDALQHYWSTTDKGLVMFNGVSWTTYNTTNSGLPSNITRGITFAPDSSIWVHARQSGIAVLKNNNWSYFNTCNSQIINNNFVGDLFTGPDGRIYIGNGDGLNIVTFDIINNIQDNNVEKSGLTAYPNPASDFIRFEVNLNGSPQSPLLEIYNTLGQMVHHSSIAPHQQSIELNVSHLDKGLYFAILKTGKAIEGRAKFVVN